MDLVTQMVLGASVGEATLGKKVGNKGILWGTVAGLIPDLDVTASLFTDTLTSIELHRGFSHSILFSLLLAPLLGWLISKIHKNEAATWRNWTLLMFLGLVTHPLLDCHTNWGTQLFWPFEIRISFANIFVIDPIYTLPFLTFLILAMIRKRTDPKRRFYNRMGLIISSTYLVITIAFKLMALNVFEKSLERQGIEYTDIQTKPTPLNSILWGATVETGDEYLIGYYSFFDSSTEVKFKHFKKNHELLGAISEEDNCKRLVKISQGWYTIEKKQDTVIFNDLRFGELKPFEENSDFSFSYFLKYENEDLTVTERPKAIKDGEKILGKLWKRLKGN
ncbi:MAG: metal-dependent hydrolase [Flavobacteriales bacterium]|nr:metal-dependent hydrolase [Flavobacteriales bacterium]